MSLRVWSDTLALPPLLASLGIEAAVLHVPGTPMAAEGPPAARIARRHYASAAVRRGHNDADVAAWLAPLGTGLERDEAFAAHLRDGRIAATFWIAVFGARPTPAPRIDPQLVARVAALGAAVFIENYSDLATGNPSKTWLPARPPS